MNNNNNICGSCTGTNSILIQMDFKQRESVFAFYLGRPSGPSTAKFCISMFSASLYVSSSLASALLPSQTFSRWQQDGRWQVDLIFQQLGKMSRQNESFNNCSGRKFLNLIWVIFPFSESITVTRRKWCSNWLGLLNQGHFIRSWGFKTQQNMFFQI